MSKVLVIGSTHGHERIGLRVIDELKKLNINTGLLDFVVGNPLASEKNIAFTETDLNRCFPGKEDGTYEERRAFELSKVVLEAEVVIDIHSTNTTDLCDESMLIVTKYDEPTKIILNIINAPKVLYMRYKSENAVISQAKIGIAFEYGMDSSDAVFAAIVHDIVEVMMHFKIIDSNPYQNPRHISETQVFEVYNVFEKTFFGDLTLDPGIKNFSLCKKGSRVCAISTDESILAEEDFVPILFGESRYTDILGFRARRLS